MKRVSATLVAALLVVAVALIGRISAADEAAEHRALVRQGAQLWGPYCGSCHNPRPAGERSPAEWDVIMLHMRVRANLPAQDADAIREFLKVR